jgi:hypothetical protein
MSYHLDRDNVKKFIAASAPDARDAVRKFIKATTHISFETFISYVNTNLEDVVQIVPPGRPLFVYVDEDNKYKSSYWMYLYLKKLAKVKYNVTIKHIDENSYRHLRDNDILLLVDDCAYTGSQMADTVEYIHTNKKKLHIILFIPFISDAAVNHINANKKHNDYLKICRFSYLKYVYKIKPLSDYMTVAEFSTIFRYTSPYSNPAEAEEEIEKFPIYFDHKLADDVSTFPRIYKGFVPNEWNLEIKRLIYSKEKKIKLLQRKKMNPKHLQQEIDTLIDQYQYYPLFSDKNIYPMPPYKTDYIDTIQTKLRNMITRSLSKGSYTTLGSIGSRSSSKKMRSI